MVFRYFSGPQKDMAAIAGDGIECSLCGSIGPCFYLEHAFCPELSDGQKTSAVGCHSCLRARRFEFWHDTEIGLLGENGLTHFYNHNQPPPPNFPAAALSELRLTPRFTTWQQGIWLVHCNDFMNFLGTWEPQDFYANDPAGDGRALFCEMTDMAGRHLWDEALPQGAQRLEAWYAAYYAFRCLHCGKLRGNWDCP